MVQNYKEILYDNERIETNRLILRRARKYDVDDILEYASDAKTVEYLDWDGANTAEKVMQDIIEFHWSRPGVWVIELRENLKCIGTIDIRVEKEHDKASFGYVLNRNYWNRGYMTEALSVLVKLGFEKLDLNRIETFHYIGNEASGRVMQKSGLIFEGISVQGVKVKGTFRDVARYGVTKAKWIENNR